MNECTSLFRCESQLHTKAIRTELLRFLQFFALGSTVPSVGTCVADPDSTSPDPDLTNPDSDPSLMVNADRDPGFWPKNQRLENREKIQFLLSINGIYLFRCLQATEAFRGGPPPPPQKKKKKKKNKNKKKKKKKKKKNKIK